MIASDAPTGDGRLSLPLTVCLLRDHSVSASWDARGSYAFEGDRYTTISALAMAMETRQKQRAEMSGIRRSCRSTTGAGESGAPASVGVACPTRRGTKVVPLTRFVGRSLDEHGEVGVAHLGLGRIKPSRTISSNRSRGPAESIASISREEASAMVRTKARVLRMLSEMDDTEGETEDEKEDDEDAPGSSNRRKGKRPCRSDEEGEGAKKRRTRSRSGTGSFHTREVIRRTGGSSSTSGLGVSVTTGRDISVVQREPVDCSICSVACERQLWHAREGRLATLREAWLDAGKHTARRLDEDVVVANPCLEASHSVCVRCLRFVAFNASNTAVGAQRPVVGCVSMYAASCDGCYADADQFRLIGSGEEHAFLAELYSRYRFPGFEVVRCPLITFAAASPAGGDASVVRCNADCLLSVDPAANGIVRCTQNERCQGTFCGRCMARCRTGSTSCPRCTAGGDRKNPEAHNHYFYRPDCEAHMLVPGNRADPRAHLMRNKEVTPEIAIHQIESLLAAERVATPCFRCGIPLTKGTMCNAVAHCGMEKCNICGYCTAVGTSIDVSHWDANGARGCPRYDFDPYWRVKTLVPFRCSQDVCYSDKDECTIPEHKGGIRAMNETRRSWHVYGMIRSLDDEKRERVMEALEANTDTGIRGEDRRAALLARIREKLWRPKDDDAPVANSRAPLE